jgi:hypothetical protein
MKKLLILWTALVDLGNRARPTRCALELCRRYKKSIATTDELSAKCGRQPFEIIHECGGFRLVGA